MLNTELKRTIFAFFFYLLCFIGAMLFISPDIPWVLEVLFLVTVGILGGASVVAFVYSFSHYVKTGKFNLDWARDKE